MDCIPRLIAMGLVITPLGILTNGSAATIVQTQGFVGTPNLQKVVEFDRFNPARGELVSAEWRLVLDIDGGQRVVDNDSEVGTTVDVYLGARGSLFSTDVKLIDGNDRPIIQADTATVTLNGATFDLASEDGDGDVFDAVGPDTATYLGVSASSLSSGIVGSEFLSDYVGSDMFRLTVEIDQQLKLNPEVELAEQVTPVTAWPNVVLVYEYQPVPEPKGVIAFLVGVGVVIGIGAISRGHMR